MRNLYAFLVMLFCTFMMQAQYTFPDCFGPWDQSQIPYDKGEEVSVNSRNYRCKYNTNTPPPSDGWELVSACGDGGLGGNYTGNQRIIGYLPTWVKDYDIKNNFNPEIVTNLNIAFLQFKQNNNNYNSANFASIDFDETTRRDVDSIMNDLGVLQKAKAKNVKVSVALGGAIDYAFLWLMTKYHNNDAKLDEIATLITNYVQTNNLDGVDLDMECWWADPAIEGTTEQAGRVRGDKWGGQDVGPHPAAVGLKLLSKKLKEKMPDKLLSGAVFGTSWFGNNYDDGIALYWDWIGLMSYDFTGSWNQSPTGPHSSLYKTPLNTYPGQSANSPIYSVQDALEYWMGIATPEWNHDGGFNVPKSKLTFGVPVYGYNFAKRKPNNGNGFEFVPYRKIIEEYPNAATSYDPLDSRQLNGYIGEDGKKLYYDTPKQAGAKLNYSRDNGHQGVIVWELTQDTNYNNPASILKAINEAAGNTTPINTAPVVTWTSPSNNQVIEQETLSAVTLQATAIDADGSIQSFSFKHNNTTINATNNGSTYTASFTPSAFGEYTIVASAADNKGATSQKTIKFTVREKTVVVNTPPVISSIAPQNGSTIEQTSLSAIALNATVTDDKEVSTVTFMVNNTAVTASKNGNQYTANWTPTAFGAVTFKVTATDNENASSDSSVTFTVKEKVVGGNTPPEISGVTPQNGATVEQTSLSAIALSATVTDDNAVSSVTFMVNNTTVTASQNGNQYTASWTPTAFGSVTFKVMATDNENESSDTTVTFTVKEKVTGGDCNGVEAWDASKIYPTKGVKVSYNGKVYINEWWTQGDTPGTSSVWRFDANCDGSGNDFCGFAEWVAAIAYNGGDQVYYNQKIYRAQWWTQNNTPDTNNVWQVVSDCAQKGGLSSNGVSFSTYVENIITYQITSVNNELVNVKLYDLSGKLLSSESILDNNGTKAYTRDLSHLRSGIYIYTISIGQDRFSQKIIRN